MLVDASVAAKLIIREPDSDAAADLVEGQRLVAPDLVFAELANILWKYHRRGSIAAPDIAAFGIADLFDRVTPCAAIQQAALMLAIELDHPVYDCFYLALAIAEDDVLVTADRRFHTACANSPHAARVQLLGQASK
jgi:predicted nucleic acid-binding protein